MQPAPLELVRLTAGYLGERGVESARADAEILLAHVLGVPRIRLYLDFEKPLQAEEVDRYRELVRRRARREPTAYITGEREFWSLSLLVDPRVLIPRPDTETLVETALAKGDSLPEPLRFLDLGVGSGAVTLAVLSERPSWTGIGVDSSEGALAVAESNGRRLGLDSRVQWLPGDLFSAVEGERFGMVLSNPPYIPSGEISKLSPEVSRFEPREALDGGPDGLDVIRRIAASAVEHLVPGGWLCLEFGAGQEGQVSSILEGQGGYADVTLVSDFAGRARVAAARRV